MLVVGESNFIMQKQYCFNTDKINQKMKSKNFNAFQRSPLKARCLKINA
jgi:hypothetical protein